MKNTIVYNNNIFPACCSTAQIFGEIIFLEMYLGHNYWEK